MASTMNEATAMMSRCSQILALGSFALSACVASVATEDLPTDDPHPDVTFSDRVHAMSVTGADTHASDPTLLAPASAAHLTYYGGKVVQNASVVQVLYGSGTYISQVSGTGTGTMASFYQQAMSSGVWDWLAEYNTSSPSQTIGRGGFLQQVQISPTSAHNGATVTDASIQAELAAKIQAGTLPAATNNTIYMVNFPAGKTITDPSGAQSCQVFCAYHGTFTIGSQNVYYGVLPDMTGSCASGCGSSPSAFANQASVASHELVETITDAEVGLSTTVGPPLAWYDTTNGEIGDICNAQQGTFTGGDGFSYTVQKEWSNQQNACITTRATSTSPDFSVADSPTSSTVAPGSSVAIHVTTSAIGGSSQSIALSVSGLPSGVTGAFSPTTVTAGGSSTLTLTAASTASGSATFTVKGTSGSTSHTATASVTVSGGTTGGGSLSSGVPVPNLSGATGAQANYTIVVPAGQTSLTVTLVGGTGDADLYVRSGSAPTLTTYDCRPYVNGNSETCTFANPAAGTWYVMLNAYATYAGVTLTATYAASTDTTTALGNNVPVTGLAGATGSTKYWKLTVPAGQTTLVFSTSGGTGDADMYIKAGAKPTTATYDCRPYVNGNTETCSFSNPTATDYYVMLRGYAAYTGVTLVGHYP